MAHLHEHRIIHGDLKVGGENRTGSAREMVLHAHSCCFLHCSVDAPSVGVATDFDARHVFAHAA
jgi:hypothetical protein